VDEGTDAQIPHPYLIEEAYETTDVIDQGQG